MASRIPTLDEYIESTKNGGDKPNETPAPAATTEDPKPAPAATTEDSKPAEPAAPAASEKTQTKMTKDVWDSLDSDARLQCLLTTVKDPDDAEEMAVCSFDELPVQVTANLFCK